MAFRLWLASFLLEHLEGRLIAQDHLGIKQRVAHQIDHGLLRQADANYAGCDRVR